VSDYLPFIMACVLFVILWVALILIATTQRRAMPMPERRMERLERKVDLVMRHLGIEEPRPDLAEVRALIDQGRKNEAIKVYRQFTGAGLKEARMAVEAVEQGLPVSR
jgi:ribosomal protein L7/L12